MLREKRFIVVTLALILLASACGQRGRDEVSAKRPAVADFSAPVKLSAANTDAAEPAIAAGSDGSLFVVWVEHRENKQSDVMLARLDANGRAVSEPVRVNARPGMATSWRGDPPTVAVGPEGVIHVGWTGFSGPETKAADIFLSTSRDAGRTFEPPVKVNDDSGTVVHGMHSLAVDDGGRIFMAWLDERNVKMEMTAGKMDEHKMEANREVFVASSGDGGRTFSQNKLVAREACPCCKTALAVAKDGRVYVAWRQVLPGNYRHIAVSSSVDGGQNFSEPVIASDDKWMIAGCPVSGPALVTTETNALRVLWYSAGEAGAPGLYWSESTDGGKSFSSRKPLMESAASGTPHLMKGPGNVLTAVWESNQKGAAKIVVARLDTGAPALSEMPAQGQLPTAVATPDALFITYIAKENEQRSIWLVRARAAA